MLSMGRPTWDSGGRRASFDHILEGLAGEPLDESAFLGYGQMLGV